MSTVATRWLTEEQVQSYHRDGYVAVRHFIDAARLAELRTVTDEFLERSRPVAKSDAVFDLDPRHTSARPVLRRIKNPADNHPLYRWVAFESPIPDIVALAATLTNDGIVNIPGTNATGAFAVATVNVGATGTITASADTGGLTLPVNIFLCQTDTATGQCISAIGPTATTQINANATPTFGIFLQGNGNVPFDPAANRIFVRFKDGGNVTRGSTSVAVQTQ